MVLKRPRTIVVEGRVDARSLATIATALTGQNVVIRSKSHLVSVIREAYCDLLVQDGSGVRVDTTTLALELLAKVGREFRATRQRGLMALSKQISSERALQGLVNTAGEIGPVAPTSAMLQAAETLMEQDND